MTQAITPGVTAWAALLSVGIGSAIGAWLRWALSNWLNTASSMLPWGTLVANVIGGYLIGLAVAVLSAQPGLSPLWRLLIVTGFLGGLTTFSSFSLESVILLGEGRWALAVLHTLLHLAGSLLATALGFWTVRLLLN